MPLEAPARQLDERPRGHARVLGTPASGKTELLLERYRHLVTKGHVPLIVAFGREQRERLLDAVWPSGTATFGRAPVTTHGNLASTILSAAFPSRSRTLRDVDELVVLDRLLARDASLLGSDLRAISDSLSFQQSLLEVLHALLQNNVSTDNARAARSRCADPRVRDVLGVYAAYRERLRETGLCTFYDVSWRAAECVARHRSSAVPLEGADVLLVDDFQDLDAGQFELIRALAPPDGSIAVEAFGDPTGARFSFRGTSDRFLREEFPRDYRPHDVTLVSPRASDAGLADTIDGLVAMLAPTPAGRPAGPADLPLFAAKPSDPAPGRGEWRVDVRTFIADDEIAEAHAAAACAAEWIRTRGMKASDVVVIARDPDRYRSLLELAFRERGVAIGSGRPGDTAVDDFVRSLVGALGRDTTRRFANALASSPLFPALCDRLRETTREDEEAVAVAERVALGLRRSFDASGVPDIERVLREIVRPVAGSQTAVTGPIEEWRRYRAVAALTGGTESVDEFRRTYMDDGSERGRVVGAVELLSAREADGRRVRAAIVVGCAEGIFPLVDAPEGYLPVRMLARALAPRDSAAARDLEARVDRDHHENVEHALLLSALTRGADALCVTSPRRVAAESMVPARALEPLMRNAVDATRTTGAATRAAQALVVSGRGGAAEGVARPFDGVAGWWVSAGPDSRRPRSDSFWLSPSGMNTFTQCKRKFLYSKLLSIRDPSTIYMAIGNAFHAVMKRVVQPGMHGAEICEALESPRALPIVDEEIVRELRGYGGWVMDLARVHLGRMTRAAARLEASRTGAYEVERVEENGEAEEDGVKIRGRVDRIDRVEGLGAVIVDYKTGATHKTSATIRDKIEDGERREYWQVPIYTLLARAMGSDPASFLYYSVPPDTEPIVVGLQLVEGRLPHPIPAGGTGARARYALIPPESLRAAVDHAAATHRSIAAGECRFERTDKLSLCEQCQFIHVCRRANA